MMKAEIMVLTIMGACVGSSVIVCVSVCMHLGCLRVVVCVCLCLCVSVSV